MMYFRRFYADTQGIIAVYDKTGEFIEWHSISEEKPLPQEINDGMDYYYKKLPELRVTNEELECLKSLFKKVGD